MSDGWIGIGMGYLQTGPFLDHLAVIIIVKTSDIGEAYAHKNGQSF